MSVTGYLVEKCGGSSVGIPGNAVEDVVTLRYSVAGEGVIVKVGGAARAAGDVGTRVQQQTRQSVGVQGETRLLHKIQVIT